MIVKLVGEVIDAAPFKDKEGAVLTMICRNKRGGRSPVKVFAKAVRRPGETHEILVDSYEIETASEVTLAEVDAAEAAARGPVGAGKAK